MCRSPRIKSVNSCITLLHAEGMSLPRCILTRACIEGFRSFLCAAGTACATIFVAGDSRRYYLRGRGQPATNFAAGDSLRYYLRGRGQPALLSSRLETACATIFAAGDSLRYYLRGWGQPALLSSWLGTAGATKARPKYDFMGEFCARISVCGQK